MFGNLLNYAILYGGLNQMSKILGNASSTIMTPIQRDLSICGKNDCQDPNVTNENLNRYEPASQTLVYILIGVTAGLVIMAMLIQIFFVESLIKSTKNINCDMLEDNHNNKEVDQVVVKSYSKKPTILWLIRNFR